MRRPCGTCRRGGSRDGSASWDCRGFPRAARWISSPCSSLLWRLATPEYEPGRQPGDEGADGGRGHRVSSCRLGRLRGHLLRALSGLLSPVLRGLGRHLLDLYARSVLLRSGLLPHLVGLCRHLGLRLIDLPLGLLPYVLLCVCGGHPALLVHALPHDRLPLALSGKRARAAAQRGASEGQPPAPPAAGGGALVGGPPGGAEPSPEQAPEGTRRRLPRPLRRPEGLVHPALRIPRQAREKEGQDEQEQAQARDQEGGHRRSRSSRRPPSFFSRSAAFSSWNAAARPSRDTRSSSSVAFAAWASARPACSRARASCSAA